MWLRRLVVPSSRILQLRIGLLIGIFAVAPFWAERGVGICLFHKLTGLECPICGMTRAFQAISHGQFIQALNFNALSLAIYFFLVGLLFHDSLLLLIGTRIPIPAFLRRQRLYTYLFLFFIILIIYAIARNVSALP